MKDTSEQTNHSRRDVLQRGALTSGALLVGSAAFAGQASGTAQRAFVYQNARDKYSILKSKSISLEKSIGRRKIPCGSNVKTEEFEVGVEFPKKKFKTTLWFAPSSFERGDRVRVDSLEEICPKETSRTYEKFRVSLLSDSKK